MGVISHSSATEVEGRKRFAVCSASSYYYSQKPS